MVIGFGDYLSAQHAVLGEAEVYAQRVAGHLSSLLVERSVTATTELALTPENIGEHVKRIRNILRDFELVNIRIFNSEGVIVYSPEPEHLGVRVQGNAGLRSALGGASSSRLAMPEDVKTTQGSDDSIPLLQTYAPILGQGATAVLGAYEIYQDFQPLRRKIRGEALRSGLSHILLLVIFAALFFRYGKMATANMEEENRRLIDKLEDRVEERTQDLQKSRLRINELLERREEMYRNLVIADEYKKNFIGLVSHELRTPLTVMKGYLTLLKDGVLPAPQASGASEAIEISLREARKLESLINNILELGQLDRGLLKVFPETFQVRGVFEESLASLETEISDRRLMVEITVHPGVATFTSDRLMLLQAVNQYLSNAAKFSPEGGKIMLTASPSHRGLVISVGDHGPGIPEAQVGDIFDLFYQVDISSTRSYEGSGLGLAIVRRISSILGGRVWVESAVGRGSTFFFELPAMSGRRREEPPPEGDDSTLILPTRQPSGGSVMVVDDDPDFRDLVIRLLENNGYAAEPARDGLDALLRLLGSGAPLPSLVVLDVRMPNVNGLDVCRILRRNVLTREIPVILVSALAGDQDVREGMASGANAYLTKPFDLEDLLRRIQFLTAG